MHATRRTGQLLSLRESTILGEEQRDSVISCSGKVSRVLRNHFGLLVLLFKHFIAFLQKWNGKKDIALVSKVESAQKVQVLVAKENNSRSCLKK